MSSAYPQPASSRSRSRSNAQMPANAKGYPKAIESRYDTNYDDPSILPRAPNIPIARGNSFRRSDVPEQPGRVDEVRSFAERAKNLPLERRLPDPPRSSPTEHIQRSASMAASSANPAPKTQARSVSGQCTPTNQYQSPSATQSTPQSRPSESTTPVTQPNSQSTPRKEDVRRRDRDWAPGRSPLQKLEVTLKDISKEEKRARVEEAEMLLREAKAARQSRRVRRDVPPVSKPSKENAQREGTVSQPSALEEAGIIRSLSTKQREKLQHSAAVESTKPPPGRFSTEREGFVYQELEPAERGKARAYDTRGRASTKPEQDPQLSLDAGANQFIAATDDYESKLQPGAPQPSSNQFRSQSYSGSKISRKQAPQAMAPSLTVDVPVRRSNSRKLQKPIPRELADQFAAGYSGNTNTISADQGGTPYANARGNDSLTLKGQSTAPNDTVNTLNNNPVDLGLPTVSNETQSGNLDSVPEGKKNENKQKRASVTFAVPPATPPPLEEWRNATVRRLTADDFKLRPFDAGKAWWEGGGSGRRKTSQSMGQELPQHSPKYKKNTAFEPHLYFKCGPLLRFTGIKRERIDGRAGPVEKEIWRGSIMIATQDSTSSYDIPPTLRIFSQPRDLLPPPPAEIRPENGEQLAPEYVDPIAGLTKLARNGKLLYVKPVDHIEEAKDLCFLENEDGLFEESPSPLDYSSSNQVSKSPDARTRELDGESVGKYKEIIGFRLYADAARDVTFWRFNLEIELGNKQEHIAYRINQGSALGFWVPAKGQTMNIMFYSGNCFGMSVDTDKFSGPDPLWRDALNVHQTRPFHVMIGGGSQIYNDAVAYETTHFQNWLDLKVKYEKHQHPFNLDIKAELEEFYLENYLHWFSQGLFGMANSQIPMINMWDDHDIIAGFGTYSDEFMNTPVFSGLGNIAFKYYMLFQHQSVPEEMNSDEPSWVLGPTPGPFIHQRSRSIFVHLGRRAALLAVDCRTERTKYEILSDDTYDLLWNRCHQEIVKGETKHLLVLISIPVAYPRMAWLGNVTSKVMDPVRSLSKVGVFGSSENKVGSGAEHLDDQWSAKLHKLERKWLIEDLQELAAEKSVRITILGGGTNLAAMGQFYADPKLEIPKNKDYRYMPNVVSSPIVNAPMPEVMSDSLNRRNKPHAVDMKTMEDMRPIFTHDVDGEPRSNKRLLPRRNWCCIREYAPGSTPIHTPSEASTPESPKVGNLVRSLSLSHGESRGLGRSFSLSRRFSMRGPPPSRPMQPAENAQGDISYGGQRPLEHQDSYFPPQHKQPPQHAGQGEPEPRPGNFIRRRTDLSTKEIKQALKRGNDMHHFIDLQGGLDITLNCEVNPSDPAGITTPYRVLVPALTFDGEFEPSVPLQKKRWWMLGRKRPGTTAQTHHDEDFSEDEYDDPPNQDATRPYTPPAQERQGQFSSPDGVGQGYGGVEAYKPKKRRFGIF